MNFYFGDPYDLSLDGQNPAFTTDDNEVVQKLKARLQFIKGEWFLDARIGLPYPDVIFEVGTDLNDVYDLLRETIMETDGVEILDSLTITPNADERSILVEFRVNNATTETMVSIP